MSEYVITVLIFAGIIFAIMVIHFIANKIVDKGGDYIRNKHIDKKISEGPEKTESLADRYRSQK